MRWWSSKRRTSVPRNRSCLRYTKRHSCAPSPSVKNTQISNSKILNVDLQKVSNNEFVVESPMFHSRYQSVSNSHSMAPIKTDNLYSSVRNLRREVKELSSEIGKAIKSVDHTTKEMVSHVNSISLIHHQNK